MKGKRWHENSELSGWVFEPGSGGSMSLEVLIAVHGISRNVDEMLRATLPLARKLDMCLLVPNFDKERFPRYQTLGAKPGQPRPDLALNRLLLRVWPEHRLRLHLFGFSGGAQFCHRYAMFWSDRIATQTLVSAGWYTCPDLSQSYPLGLGKIPKAFPPLIDPVDYTKIPTQVLVGGKDTERQPSLRQTPEIDAMQGYNRKQRAIHWHQQWQKRYPSSQWRIGVLEDVGHDFWVCASESNMLFQTAQFLKNEVEYAF